jgi:hypothetical protein
MKTVSARFTRTDEYSVLVRIPDEAEMVTQHGQTFIKVHELFLGLPSDVLLSLQVAAARGLVSVEVV